MLTGIYAEVANMLFARGAFQFGDFELKLHEKNPDAPLSPFYVNMRTQDNPGTKGPLITSDCELIGRALWHKTLDSCLDFQAIAGLPHAADPFIEAIDKIAARPKGFRVIKLAKHVTENRRRIIPAAGFEYQEGERVLLFDDLITGGDSKIEAIQAVESQGSIVAGLIVLLHREQGGVKQVESAGYNIHYCFTISELLNFYLSVDRINQQKYKECLDYIKNN